MKRIEDRGDFIDRLMPDLTENITSTIITGASSIRDYSYGYSRSVIYS